MYRETLSEEDANKFLATTDVNDDFECPVNKPEEKPTAYAWFVLFLVFCIRAIHQMHRQVIGFAFGYQSVGK
jgi:hypothetical protein